MNSTFNSSRPNAGRSLEFTVSKTTLRGFSVSWGSGNFEDQCSWLCWDELLWWLAEALGHGNMPSNAFDEEFERELGIGNETIYELKVSTSDGSYWTIEKDTRFMSYLCASEALGVLAAFTLDGREMFTGFKTYEQWHKSHYCICAREPIAALLR